MKKTKKYYFTLKEVVIMVIVTSIIISFCTGVVINKRYESSYSKNITITDENINNFLDAYETLTDKYYEEVDKDALMNSVISSMFNYFQDPYTTYLDETETTALVDSLSGSYKGIGVGITKDDRGIVVITVLPNSSASDKGVEVGDVITKINGEDVTYKPVSSVIETITTSQNNKVTVTVLRSNRELTFNLTVGTVDIPSITYEIIADKIGYIDIETFSLTTSKQVRERMNSFNNLGIKSLIIDVRDNAGGYLSIAEDIAKIFLEKGQVIYSIENKEGTTVVKDDNRESSDIEVIILINENSASASEVLAAALIDSYGAKTVGATSYGKGKVQQAETLDNGTMFKYTIAKWLRPNGECIDEVGIIPDYEIENASEVDNQLLKAIELLEK